MLLFCGKGLFFQFMKNHPIKKNFFSILKFQFRTASKLTCSYKFHQRKPTVSLQYNNPFSKNIGLAFALRQPFRTDSKPHRRYPESLQCPARPGIWWTPVTSAKAMNRAEIWIAGRRRSPVCFLCYFLHNAKSDNPYSLAGSFEVLRTSNQLAAMAASLKQN